jgi:uncharacterized membrane-anchored protein YjiN (DUF445 family)
MSRTMPLGAGRHTAADAARARGLRRMRGVALGLLLAAALVFASTLHRGDPWTFVHATAEAAMVGAIADWFAVTALFRHPLGLPIPHTAIIPTRKLALGRSLQDFVTENFLAEDVVRERVAEAQVSDRLGRWLSAPPHARRVVDEVAAIVRTGLVNLQDDDVAALLQSEILPRLIAEPLSEVTGKLLGEVVSEGAHHGLVDLALHEGHRWLRDNQATVVRVLGTRAPWWTPLWVDDKVTHRVYAELLAWVDDIRGDPRHEARRALDDLLGQVAADLQADEATMQRAERLKVRILTQPQVVTSATAVWNVVRAALVTTIADPASPLRERGIAQLVEWGGRMVSERAIRDRIDAYAGDAAAFVVTRYGDEISTVITSTIQRWDGKEAARRIELHVGRDLQFIRINGTLVGGLAGLVIYGLGRLA